MAPCVFELCRSRLLQVDFYRDRPGQLTENPRREIQESRQELGGGERRGAAGVGRQLFERRNFAWARKGIFRSARPDRPLALTEHMNRLAEASSERVVVSV